MSSVYFIECAGAGAIKIGRTKDIESRLYGLQCGCPLDLRLLATVPGGAEKESELHNKFAGLHMRGEWFRAEPELIEYAEAAREEMVLRERPFLCPNSSESLALDDALRSWS